MSTTSSSNSGETFASFRPPLKESTRKQRAFRGRQVLRKRSVRVATDIGRGFAYLFIGLGIAMFIFQGSFGGAWLAFIGWFLGQAASAEARYIAYGGSAQRTACARLVPPVSGPTGATLDA
jgi:hypothetical protein